jgi:translation initiation factor 1
MIVNLQDFDPFSDATSNNGSKIHLRCQARNGRKCISTVQGLTDSIDLKKILRTFKKKFSCNGAIKEDDEMGKIIQLSGDQRANIKEFLIKNSLAEKEDITIHG